MEFLYSTVLTEKDIAFADNSRRPDIPWMVWLKAKTA